MQDRIVRVEGQCRAGDRLRLLALIGLALCACAKSAAPHASPSDVTLRDAGESDAATRDDAALRCRTQTLYSDGDGDHFGAGAPRTGDCIGEPVPAGFALQGEDCDDSDPQRSPGFYEAFADGADSDCNGEDDPIGTEPCTCDWVEASDGAAVKTACEAHFEPDQAALVVAAAHAAARKCEGGADLALEFAVQCKSDCFGSPIYFTVANVGSARSQPATVRVEGNFRQPPPRVPLVIAPLDPGQRSDLTEVLATGEYRIRVEPGADECDTNDNELAFDAYDLHCGFF